MKYRELMNFLDQESQHAEERREEAIEAQNYSEALCMVARAQEAQRVKLWAISKQLEARRTVQAPNRE